MTDYRYVAANALRGKVVVVTGAGPGLGTTLSRMFAGDGATVVAVARTAREIPATVITGATLDVNGGQLFT